ncbi:MAG: GNAT family N-acetyltransferase [Rickettsiales bacterium]|nr:GNAT family N-acetyltransferase [Rickettsiales bacterium]
MNEIEFIKASLKYKQIIFSWLDEPHMIEFWDNSQEHKDDILNFIHNRKQHYFSGTTQYFIGLINNEPFAFLLADVISPEENLPLVQENHMPKHGHAISIDFGIGNKDYLGKGLATSTLKKFISYYQEQIDNKANTFFIDPSENNSRAKHVYKKAGFKYIGKFNPTEGAFIDVPHLLMVKKF